MMRSLVAWSGKLPEMQFEFTDPGHRVAIRVSIEIGRGDNSASLCDVLASEANDFAQRVRNL